MFIMDGVLAKYNVLVTVDDSDDSRTWAVQYRRRGNCSDFTPYLREPTAIEAHKW
jgi:hypothetical protein